jgi:hypothetical protein
MVDLPGYGFAKANAKNRLQWFGFTSEYFLERRSLIMVMLLVDASIPPQRSDIECLQWMADREVCWAHHRRRPSRRGSESNIWRRGGQRGTTLFFDRDPVELSLPSQMKAQRVLHV